MASNRSSEANRASSAEPTDLHPLTHTDDVARRSAPADSTVTDAAARAADRAKLEQSLALEKNARLARSPGAIGPMGRVVLLIAALALAGLIGVWLLIAY